MDGERRHGKEDRRKLSRTAFVKTAGVAGLGISGFLAGRIWPGRGHGGPHTTTVTTTETTVTSGSVAVTGVLGVGETLSAVLS